MKSSYRRFLNIIAAVDRTSPGKALDELETQLLEYALCALNRGEAILVGDLLKLTDVSQSKDAKNQVVTKKAKKQDEKEEKQEAQTQNASKQNVENDTKSDKKTTETQNNNTSLKASGFDDVSKNITTKEDDGSSKKEQSQAFVKTDDVQEIKYKAAPWSCFFVVRFLAMKRFLS